MSECESLNPPTLYVHLNSSQLLRSFVSTAIDQETNRSGYGTWDPAEW